MTIGKRLEDFIKKAYKMQREFAATTGISAQQVNNYVTNRSKPSVSILKKFNVAGLNLNWLLMGNGSMFARNETGDRLRLIHEDSTHGSILMDGDIYKQTLIGLLTVDQLRAIVKEAILELGFGNQMILPGEANE
jgi:transcriptional regulator with XRE-family HTH domain